MAGTSYHHGVRVLEVASGARTITTVSTAIIGLVATAPDADDATFPLDRPALITDVVTAMGKAGSAGTLYQSLLAISQQARPVIVVVRVPEGAGETAEEKAAATTTNVIGTVTEDGQKTGMQALLAAQAQLGVKPRILGAPGLDTQAVTTAFIPIAQSLRAMVYARAIGDDTAALIAYRNQFSSRELMLIAPNFLAWDSATSANVEVPAVAYALGLRAKIDEEVGWNKTLSNVAVNGVTGLSRDISWDMQDTGTDADLLNQAGITTLINQNGYRFWGSRTCADDTNFIFESATRTAQVIADSIAEAQFQNIDAILLPGAVRDIIEAVNARMRSWKTGGYLLGGSCWYDETENETTDLKAGKLRIDYDYTPTPPIEDLAFNQRITDTYWSDFSSQVTSN